VKVGDLVKQTGCEDIGILLENLPSDNRYWRVLFSDGRDLVYDIFLEVISESW